MTSPPTQFDGVRPYIIMQEVQGLLHTRHVSTQDCFHDSDERDRMSAQLTQVIGHDALIASYAKEMD